jgi:nucleoside-diphosphate-sugar epimerase
MSSFQNILLLGPSGSIGSLILRALDEEPDFNLTLLKRASSKAELPSHLKTIKIADTFPTDDLISAFRGQDVIINCITYPADVDQYRLVDAATAAGVKRYIPSEYGLNNARPEPQALSSVFREKGEVQAYLRSKANEGAIEWMSISCGMWLRWSMAHEFLGMHVGEKKFVLWDDGEGMFSCTTEENTAAGLIRALKSPEDTKNRTVYLSDFAISQNQLLESIERIQGVKYATESIDSHAYVAEKQAAVAAGDRYAVYSLIETGFVTGRYGGHLEKEGEIMNGKLGLPKKSLDEVVEAGLKSFGAI